MCVDCGIAQGSQDQHEAVEKRFFETYPPLFWSRCEQARRWPEHALGTYQAVAFILSNCLSVDLLTIVAQKVSTGAHFLEDHVILLLSKENKT